MRGSQIVDRDGGIVALRLLSHKVDRIQESVDRTTAELAMQRLRSDMEDLEARYNELAEAHAAEKDLVHRAFFILAGIVAIVLLAALAYSVAVGVTLAIILTGIPAYFGRGKYSKLESEYERESERLVEKGVEIKKKIQGV